MCRDFTYLFVGEGRLKSRTCLDCSLVYIVFTGGRSRHIPCRNEHTKLFRIAFFTSYLLFLSFGHVPVYLSLFSQLSYFLDCSFSLVDCPRLSLDSN